jgi:phage tail-like protein
MAETQYPIPAFHFRVDWGGASAAFSEVSGLTVETQVVEYRDGLSPIYSTIKMPGMQQNGNITLKRGIFKANNEFFDWWNQVALNTHERREITIALLDEGHEPVMVWKVANAWPIKVEGPSLNATGNEAAVESMELAHEGITVQNG